MGNDFEVLSPEEAAMVRAMRNGSKHIGITDALVGGATVWFPHRRVSNYYGSVSAKGYRLHARWAERDGVKGAYLWAEKVEAPR